MGSLCGQLALLPLSWCQLGTLRWKRVAEQTAYLMAARMGEEKSEGVKGEEEGQREGEKGGEGRKWDKSGEGEKKVTEAKVSIALSRV